MRTLLALVRLTTLLAPISILTFWGGSYLYACIEFLANPRMPVEFRYQAPGKLPVTLSSSTYVMDLDNGNLKLIRPKAMNSAGVVLFYADLIEAIGLPTLFSDSKRAIVDVRNAFGTIERKPDGNFDIFDYLPKQEGPSGNFPYEVNVDIGKLKVVEATGKIRYVQNATVRGLSVVGVGDRWVGSGNASIRDVGNMTMSIQNEPRTGVWLRGKTEQLQLAQLFRVFRQTREGAKTPQLMNVGFQSLTVYGPFELFIPADKAFRLYSEVNAESRGFRYGNDFQADWAKFSGVASADGMQGTLTARDPDIDAVFRGVANWRDGFKMDGSLDGTAGTLAALPRPIRTAIPRELDVRGPIGFDGRLAYDAKNGIRANGIAKASSLRVYDETVEVPQVLVDYSPSAYRFAAQQGTWRGSPLSGSLAMAPKSRGLTGSIRASNVNLAGLARRLNLGRLSGTGDIDIQVSGSLEKPIAHVRASTEHRYAWTETMSPQRGRGRFAATMQDSKLLIDQAYVVSPAGSLSATGSYDLNSRQVSLNTVGSGVDLNLLNPDLNGIGRFKGSVTGVLDRIRYQGTAELFGLKVQNQSIPVVTAVIQGDSKSVTASKLQVVKGAGKASGDISLRFRDMALDGRFNAEGVQLSDFLGEEYLASIDLNDARLGGTFKNPTFDAKGRANDILILGARIDGAEAVVTYLGNVLKVDEFNAVMGEGKVSGYLEYRPRQKSGQASFRADNVALEPFVPATLAASLSGRLSGEGGVTFDNTGFRAGSAEGTVADLLLNETPLGGGTWKLTSNGADVSGELEFGVLERFVQVGLNRYGLNSKEIDASIWISNMGVQDVRRIAEQYIPTETDERLLALLYGAEGNLGVYGLLTGTLDEMSISSGKLTAQNLQVGGRPAGSLQAALNKTGRVWNFESIDWTGGPMNLQAKGAFEEGGVLGFEGTIEDADISYLSLFDPMFASMVGRVDSTVKLTGTSQNPKLEAKVSTDSANSYAEYVSAVNPEDKERLLQAPLTYGGIAFLNKDGKPTSPLSVSFDTITATNWKDGIGGLAGEMGRVKMAGYTGNLSLKLPFRFPFEFVTGAPVFAQLALDQRDVKDVDVLAAMFDPQKSIGHVSGLIDLSGTADQPTIAGDIRLNAEKLVFRQGGQELKGVEAGLQLLPNRLGANVVATSADGGRLEGTASANLPSIQRILEQVPGNRINYLLRSPVSGALTTSDLALRAGISKDGVATGTVTSSLEIAGTMRQPRVTGDVNLHRAYLRMPTEVDEERDETEFLLDPYLDLNVRTGSARFENTTANIEMSGSGTVTGTLQELDAYALLRLNQGILRLPTSRINLEPGGIVRPYLAINSGIPDARLDIEIEGNTRAVGPSKIGQGAQRYDIHMNIRGDLLQDGGLTLSATSSPSDLTQDEIFALIGRLDLIEGLASGVQSGRPEEDIRNAIYGLTPYYLDPYFSKLASTLGLDYITPEINTIDGISVLFGKTLARNLTISGSRQVTQVNQNYPAKYDLSLTYTLRFGDRADRRRVNFIIGTDEVRPWRIAIEYTFRF